MIDRVLIVGHGSIGRLHLMLARRLLQHADIRVLRHRQSDIVPDGANGTFGHIDDALTFGAQLAVVANAAPFHIAAATRLADSGAHLLVEKPLSHDVSGIEELIARCKILGRILLIGYNLRFSPSLRRFRKLVHSGSVGRIISVRTTIGQYLPEWRPGYDYQHSVSAQKKLGGGVLRELSHELDYLRWIFGEPKWVMGSVGCDSELELDVEDVAHLVVALSPELGGPPLVAAVTMDFFRRDTTRFCEAIGAKGTLRWDGIAGTVHHFDAGRGVWELIFSQRSAREDTYASEWMHWLQCIEGTATPLVTGLDGLRVMQLIEAARWASKTGTRQLLPAAPIPFYTGQL